MESIFLFIQIKIRITYNIIFVKTKIFIALEMIVLKNWFWNRFHQTVKLGIFHFVEVKQKFVI